MNRAKFFEHFNLLAGQPDAVAKMRDVVLQLAIQGRLLPFDATDKSAVTLVSGIRAEKKSTYPKISVDELPFTLPPTWELVRIGEAMHLINGRAFKPTDWARQGLPIVRIQNLNNPDAPHNYCDFEVDKKFLLQNGDFLISWSGTPGTSFGAFIWNRGKAVLNQHIFRAELVGEAYIKEFLRLAVNGRLEEMIAQAHGAVGLQHITKGKLEQVVLPLPPLAEQKRIVAKVDELMTLCDELETRQQARQTARVHLQESSFYHLLSAREPKTFTPAWKRVYDNFHLLHETPESISQLRQAILQLAIQGRLVPQNSEDEPAESLLERINAPWQAMKDGPIGTDGLLQLPRGWVRARCQELCDPKRAVTYGIIKLGPHVSGGVPVLRSSNVRYLSLETDQVKCVGKEIANGYARTFLKGGEILITVRGTLGGVAVVPPSLKGANISREVAVLPILAELVADFLAIVIASPGGQAWLTRVTKGIAYAGINIKDLKELPIAVPPLAEQKRIVTRVKELMRHCNALEKQFRLKRGVETDLMDAALHRLLTA